MRFRVNAWQWLKLTDAPQPYGNLFGTRSVEQDVGRGASPQDENTEETVVERDIAAELRRAEERQSAAECRLQQLTQLEAATDQELDEAVGLTNTLSIIGVYVRRLRLELIKSRTT
jgi:hypothetical protein